MSRLGTSVNPYGSLKWLFPSLDYVRETVRMKAKDASRTLHVKPK